MIWPLPHFVNKKTGSGGVRDLPKYLIFPTYQTISSWVYECMIFPPSNLSNVSSKSEDIILSGIFIQEQKLLLAVRLTCLYRMIFKNSAVLHIQLGIKTVVQLFEITFRLYILYSVCIKILFSCSESR